MKEIVAHIIPSLSLIHSLLVPSFVIAGVVVLMLGAVSYFAYDPYRVDKRNRKKANSYIKEMEKAALKALIISLFFLFIK